MMKFKKYFLAAFLFVAIANGAHAQNAYDVSKTGLRYKIHKDVPGRNAQVGDVLEFHLINKAPNDSVLFTTYDGQALNMQLSAPQYGGDVMDGFSMLSAGDSATIWVSVDSIPDFPAMPGLLEKGDYLRYTVKLIGVYTQQEFEQQQKKAEQELVAKEGKQIEDFLKKNKIKGYQKTASGLYYVIDKKGPDANAKPGKGKKVKVHYVGTLLDGKKFDSSRDRNQPFEFTLGIGQVIPGWDEGIALLSKGSRGRLFIPSKLGYGAQGAGEVIPPDSILVFDVELIDF